MRNLLLAFLLTTILTLTPYATFGSTADLSPAVSGLTKQFSEKFCTSIAKGLTPEKAGETSAIQISKVIYFSPVMNEIMSASREDLAASLSNNIFDGCGNDLGGSKEELDNYIAKLVTKVPKKSQGLNLPPVRQKIQ